MTVTSGALLSDALVHSPIVAGEDGSGAPPASMAGYEFGVDPNIDPELALVSHVFTGLKVLHITDQTIV